MSPTAPKLGTSYWWIIYFFLPVLFLIEPVFRHNVVLSVTYFYIHKMCCTLCYTKVCIMCLLYAVGEGVTPRQEYGYCIDSIPGTSTLHLSRRLYHPNFSIAKSFASRIYTRDRFHRYEMLQKYNSFCIYQLHVEVRIFFKFKDGS